MTVTASDNLAIPQGSRVLVSGANGFIASHIVKQLLRNGYKVRGTVRNVQRSSWLIDHFEPQYGKGSIELVEVPDMQTEGAFDEAAQGVAGFIHTATPVMQLHDPNIAVPMVVEGTKNALKSAVKAGVKRFVLTSSSTAASDPIPNKVFTIDEKTWNEDAVKEAWAPPPYEGVQRKLKVYSATKTQGEQAAWEFIRNDKSGITLNTVLPNANLGEILSVEHQGFPSTTGWIKAVWNGFKGEGEADLKENPPQYYINVDDDAAVHVAALVYDDVKSERLFTFAKPFNLNDLLALFRQMYPDKSFVPDFEGLGRDKSIVANGRAEELLKRIDGHGWTGLEESIKPITDVLAAQ